MYYGSIVGDRFRVAELGDLIEGNEIDLRASVDKVAGIIADFPSSGGPKWTGQTLLADNEIDPENVAQIILAIPYEGCLATDTCFKLSDLVASAVALDLDWKQSWDLGRFLLSCLTYTEIYRLEREEEKGAYYLVRDQITFRQEKKNTTTQINTPFPHWSSPVDRLGNRLIKPSGPQERKTEWQPGPDQFSVSVLDGQPAAWIQAIHQLESIPYRINQEVLDIAKRLDSDPLTRVHPIPTPGRRFDPSRRWLIANLTDRAIRSRRQSFEEVIDEATRLKENVFYQRAYADYRGRFYLPSFSYAGSDLNRAIVEFADGVPMTQEGWDYLMLHTANVYGDNADFEEKISTSKSRLSLYLQVSNDPVGSFEIWSKADKPFCFLRACCEVRNIIRTCKNGDKFEFERFVSHLPCELDQSNSAYQHISLIMNDEELGKLSNLQGEYSDLYKTVADKLLCPAEKWEKRKIVKKVAVPWGYGASDVTIIRQLREWKNNENKAQYLRSLNWEELSELVTEVRRVIESIAPTVAKFRKEVSVVIGKRLGKGASELIWQTPMMFEVHQRFMKIKKLKAKVFSGHDIVELRAERPINEVEKRKHRSATAPNIVHSFDAAVVHSLLWNASYSGGTGNTQVSRTPLSFPVVTIHDAFSAHAPNLPELRSKLLKVIGGLYTHFDPFNNWLMLVGGEQQSRQISSDWIEKSKNAFS